MYDIFSTAQGINGLTTIVGGATTFAFRPQGFSSYHTGGAHFVMGDGGVRFLSENISQVVFSNLATRMGNDTVGEF